MPQILIHHEAMCCECNWKLSARNAQAVAQVHSNKTGHRVEIQLGYVARPNK